MINAKGAEMIRCAVCMLTLTLLAVVACTSSAQPTQEPGPRPGVGASAVAPTHAAPATLALATPDWSRLMSDQLTAGDPAKLDLAAQEFTNWMREAMDVRAQLGSQADEVFRQVDEAQARAVQDIVRQLQVGSKPKGMPAPLPPFANKRRSQAQFKNFGTAFGLLVATHDLFRGSFQPTQSTSGSVTLPAFEYNDTETKNARSSLKMQPQINGPTVQVEVEVVVRFEKDGVVYEEKGSGKISLNACPDEQGNVPLDLTLQGSAAAGSSGYQIRFTDHAIGHVDDEGNLTTVDEQVQTEMSGQPGKNAKTGQDDNMYAQINHRLTWGGMNAEKPSVNGYQGTLARSSSKTTQEFVDSSAKMGLSMAILAEMISFRDAEKRWQSGYCVGVAVADAQTERVVPVGSETAFTVIVRHKFEGKELKVPVIADLASGQVSVTPSGTKVPAPAMLRYKAPDKADEKATVELVSRSRRGIGRLTMTFLTRAPKWHVEGTYWGYYHLAGTICDGLDKPFVIAADGGDFTFISGQFTLNPTSTQGGNWTFSGSMKEVGSVTASGTFQIEGAETGAPVLLMGGGHWTVAAPFVGTTPIGPGGEHLGITERIELRPSSEGCP